MSGTKRWELASKYSVEQLREMMVRIQDNPKSKAPEGSFRVYTKAAEVRLNDIARAIQMKLSDSK